MQIISPEGPARSRVGFFVPRWTEPRKGVVQGVPFRCLQEFAALHAAGFELVYVDHELDLHRQRRRRQIQDALLGVRLVFIWLNELDPALQVASSLELAQLAKACAPGIQVVVGGALLTSLPARVLRAGGLVDHYLRGYGQRSCVELAEQLLDLERPPGRRAIAGLVGTGSDGGQVAVAIDRRRLPIDDRGYRVLDLSPYIQKGGVFGNDQDTLALSLSRGCAKRCSFCYWRNHHPELATAEQLVDLLGYLAQRYGVSQFHIAELDFATHKRRLLAFCRSLTARHPQLRWFALMSPRDLAEFSAADFDTLRAGGCAKVELGTEHGSPAMLELLGKRHDPLLVRRIHGELISRGIHVMHNFLFALPGESRRDRRRSLRLIHGLRAADPARSTFTFRFFQPCYGTPLGDQAIAMAPDFPQSLEALVAGRAAFGLEGRRGLAWVDARTEREVKALCYYFLPMVCSRLRLAGPLRRGLYRVLRGTARLRLRLGNFALPLDRWLWSRLIAAPLDCTYTP